MIDPMLRQVIAILSLCEVCWPAVSEAKRQAEAKGEWFIPFEPCPICMAGLRVVFPEMMAFIGFTRPRHPYTDRLKP